MSRNPCSHPKVVDLTVPGSGRYMHWCPDCGALRRNDRWRSPGMLRREMDKTAEARRMFMRAEIRVGKAVKEKNRLRGLIFGLCELTGAREHLDPEQCAEGVKEHLGRLAKLPELFKGLGQEMLEQVTPVLRKVHTGEYGAMQKVYEECARMVEEALQGLEPLVNHYEKPEWCPACEGTGVGTGENSVCPVCGGLGLPPIPDPCPRCGGTGEYGNSAEHGLAPVCTVCKGTGVAPEEDDKG